MDASEHTYYSRRIRQEEALAASATCDASRIAHRRLAKGYREMVAPRAVANTSH